MRRNRFRLNPSKMEGLLIQKSSDSKGLSVLIFDGVSLLRERMLQSWESVGTDSSLKTVFCAFVISYTDYSDLFLMEFHLGLPRKFS